MFWDEVLFWEHNFHAKYSVVAGTNNNNNIQRPKQNRLKERKVHRTQLARSDALHMQLHFASVWVCRFIPYVELSDGLKQKQLKWSLNYDIDHSRLAVMKASCFGGVSLQLAWNFMLWILKRMEIDPGKMRNIRLPFGSELNSIGSEQFLLHSFAKVYEHTVKKK